MATVQVETGGPASTVTAAVEEGNTICLTISGQLVCAQSTNSIDYCQPNPCKNGATCTSSDSGPLCTCTSSFCGDCCAQLAHSLDSCPGGVEQQCPLLTQASTSGGSSAGAAIGAGVGAGLALVVLVVVLVVWIQRRGRKAGGVAPGEPIGEVTNACIYDRHRVCYFMSSFVSSFVTACSNYATY